MSLYHELSSITIDRLTDVAVMYLDSDSSNPDNQNQVAYLQRTYPALTEFATRMGVSLYGKPSQEELEDSGVTHFVYGAVTAMAILARHAELEMLEE